MSIRIAGRSALYRWDTAQRALAPGAAALHMCSHGDDTAYVVEPGEDGAFPVPDELLQRAGALHLYLMEGGAVAEEAVVPVRDRAKPADYVFTPTEQATLEGVVDWVRERMAHIDYGGLENLPSIGGRTVEGERDLGYYGLAAAGADDIEGLF